MAELHKVFSSIDTDKDNSLDIKEIKDTLKSLNIQLDEEKFTKMWNRLDVDKNGKVSIIRVW